MQSYLLIKRYKEEVTLLTSDMLATLKYWRDQVISVGIAHQEVSQVSRCDVGLRCLLQRLKLDAKVQHHRAANAFSKCVQIPDELMLDTNMNNDDSEVDRLVGR